MSKPKFDPSKAFTVVEAKPAFDPSKPFEAVDEPSDTPWADVPMNALKDLKGQAKGLAETGIAMAKSGGLAPIKTPIKLAADSVAQMISGDSFFDTPAYTVPTGIVKGIVEQIKEEVTSPIESFKQRPVTTVLDATMLGGIAKSGIQKAASIATKMNPAAITPAVESAAKFGVELTPAEISGRKSMALIESLIDKNPFTPDVMQKFRATQGQQLESVASDLIEQLGSRQSKEVVGTAAQEAILQKNFKRLQVRDKLYKRLTNSVPDGTVIGTDTLQETAKSLLLKESQLPTEAQNQTVTTFLGGMTKIRQQGLSFQGAQNLRERLTSMIGPMADTPEKQVFKQIKNALDQDFAAFSERSGGAIEKAWKRANSFHGAVKELASDPNVKSVLSRDNPSAIVNSIMSSRNTLQLKMLRKAMPENAFKEVQSAVVDRLFEGGANQTTAQALSSNLKRYGNEFLEVALPKAKLDRLMEFSRVIEKIQETSKMSANSSGTAQNVIASDGFSYFVRHPIKGTVVRLAGNRLAKIYLSDFGRQIIREGINLPVKSPRAAVVAGALSSLGQEKNQPKKVYADTVTKAKMPTFSTMKEAREASKDIPDNQEILIQGTRAKILAPGRKRGPGAPKAIQFLESPPEGLL